MQNNYRKRRKRYFTVKLLKSSVTQEYEGTVYFEISGKIKDEEINQVILNHLEPKYKYVGLFIVSELLQLDY